MHEKQRCVNGGAKVKKRDLGLCFSRLFLLSVAEGEVWFMGGVSGWAIGRDGI